MDNIFNDLAPPNMDIRCETSVEGSSTIQTCSDPWNYYKAYGFDIVIVVIVAWIIIKALTKD